MSDTKASDVGVIRLNSADQFVSESVIQLNNAIRQIDILTNDLDKPWLGEARLAEQLKLAIVKNKRLHVRVAIANPSVALKTSHLMIPLIKRLSRCQAQVINEEMLEKQPLKLNFMLIDRGGLVVKQSNTDYFGFSHHDDKQTVGRLRETFEEYWRYSEPHADLRYMTL